MTAPAAPPSDNPATMPLPAATLLLLRDGPDGIEVLMTTRHAAAGFAGGAMVFPGGKVDPDDHRLARSGALGSDLDADALAFRIAAIRETFEECGVLMARARGGDALPAGADLATIRRRLAAVVDFGAVLAEAAIEPAADLLVPFAHWITPPSSPKRFDTRFFLAPAPPGQTASHDGREAVAAAWITPRAALADTEAGRRNLVFATYMNVRKLARYPTVAEALEAARQATIVTVMPEVINTPDGILLRIPAQADYGATEVPAALLRRA